MNVIFKYAAFAVALILGTGVETATAEIKVVATLQDLGSVAQFVGGDDVSVTVLCPGEMDPHYLPAKPSLARTVAKADLLIYNGLELEVGWLPQLINKARNPDVRPGSKGDVDCSRALDDLLEVPGHNIDRGGGDVHPQGNPHYTLDPNRMVQVAAYLATRFADVDPDRASAYRQRATAFAAEVARREPEWQAMTAAARQYPVIIYHRSWAYLVDWLHLNVVGEIEHRPGIAPSPRHVEELIIAGRDLDNLLIMAATWDHLDVARQVAKRSGGSLTVVPGQTHATDGVPDYFALIDTICRGLATAAGQTGD